MVAKASVRGDDRRFVLRHAVAQLLLWSGFYYLFPAVMPHLIAQTGWPAVNVSGALSLGFLVWALLSPLAGRLVDRGHGVAAMRCAGLLGAVLLAVAAAAQSWIVAACAFLALGLPMSMTLYDPCFALMIRRFGADTSGRRALTAITLIAGFATLLTFPLVAWLAAAGLSWRWILVVFAGLVMIATLAVPGEGAIMRSQGVPHAPAAGGEFAKTLLLGLAFSLVMFGHAVLLFQLPAYLLSRNGDATALMLPMVLGPSQIAGRLAWEAAQSRVPVETAGLALFVFMLLPPLILLGDSGESTVLAVLVLQGAGYGIHTILRPVLAARWLTPAGLGAKFGWIAMIGLLMMAAAPFAGSTASARGGFEALTGLVLGADLLALALLFVMTMLMRRARYA